MRGSGPMKGLAWLLAATTLVSASATVYYALALQREQARSGPERSTTRSLVQETTSGKRDPLPPSVAAPSASAAPEAISGSSAGGSTGKDPGHMAVAHHRLEELRDPQFRERETRKMAALQRISFNEMAPYLGLSAREIDLLSDVYATINIDLQQRMLECEADPSCDARAMGESLVKSAQEDFTSLLGPERSAKAQAFEEASEERMRLQAFRDRLAPADRPSSEQMARLTLALAAERQQFDRDAESRNEKVDAFTPASVSFFELRSAAVPGSSDEPAQRLESATRYGERLRKQASEVLSGASLTAFKDGQERALAAYRARIREKEIADAARKAAGRP